ncbi:MAG: hypothetical protein KDD10_29035 [Phaeodactylibacter sp.]|nr:hypothetical protein [Sinomicrobium sp.]MCB0583359.1 hypothetical protein [Phaeodactylibacter sp.]
MSRKNLQKYPSIEILGRAIRREWRLKLLASLLLLAFGGAFVYLSFGEQIILVLFGLISASLGIRFTFQLLKENRTRGGRLMYLLEHRPEHIVWVYAIVTERLPFGLQLGSSCTMYFKLMDGDEVTVGLSAKKQQQVSMALNRLLPHATFGYTRDREQWYMANPAMLLRDGA